LGFIALLTTTDFARHFSQLYRENRLSGWRWGPLRAVSGKHTKSYQSSYILGIY